MVGWGRRCCVGACVAVLWSAALVGDVSPVAVEATAVAVESPSVVGVVAAPLGVSGEAVGESLKADPVADDVLVEPPSDAVPSDESLEERLDRERAASVEPAVEGFDEVRSVEDVSERSEFASTYENVDGTSTMIVENKPVHFRSNGRWVRIEPQVVRKNGEWVTKAGDRLAKFSSKRIELVGRTGSVRFAPAGVVLPEPVVSDGGLTVTYPQVWPGVDLRYRLETDSVKEEIVINDPSAVPLDGSFAFEVSGPGLRKNADGRVGVEGALGSELFFGDAEVFDAKGAPISGPDQVRIEVGDRKDDGNGKIDRLTVGVDPVWAVSLPADAFPLVLDPTLGWNTWQQVATDNWGIQCSTNPACNRSRVGNSWWGPGQDHFWHSVVQYDYSAVLPTASVQSQLYNASLHISYAGGVTSSEPIAVRHATSYGYCGTNYNGNCYEATTPYLPLQWLSTGVVYYDVTSLMSPYWTPGGSIPAFALSSSENPGYHTYKELNTALYINFDRLPVITASAMSPGNPHTFHSSGNGVSLSINPLSDPDGETLYYRFVLCEAGCPGIVDDSGWRSGGTPWIYTSGLYPPGPGLTAWFYNRQLYWTVMVSNSPTGAGFVSYAPQWNSWMLVNSCPATPQMFDPGGGSGSFTWAPNQPPTLSITPYADPDGDAARYRFVIREKGSGGLVYTSAWSALSTSTAPIPFTVPADAPLQPGVSYEWSSENQDQPTYFHYYQYKNAPCSAASSFRAAEFEARLGSSGPSPFQALGPVSVNLATGNVATTVATPQVSTLGGSMGASISYNARANDIGLRARLFNDSDNNGIAGTGELVTSRVDRAMSFKWSSPGAAPGITNFVGTWTGYVTVPTTGTYQFAAAVGGDERVEVNVGSSYTMRANYVNATAIGFGQLDGRPVADYNSLANVSAPAGFSATAFQPIPITVTYRNPSADGYLNLFVSANGGNFATLPITWLSPDDRVLPRGWTLSQLEGSGASYTAARVESTEIVLTRPDGSTVSYARNSVGGYTPPPGEDDVVTTANGRVSVTDTAGYVHEFLADGQLASVTAPTDTKTPAAPVPTFTSVTLPGATMPTSRMTVLTDPISGRQVTFKYQGVGTGSCPDTTAPAAMLCQITYPDGSATTLTYVADGQGGAQLAQVRNPGDGTIKYPTVDFGYTQVSMPAPSGGTYSTALLSSVRDPLVNDAIAFGQITASIDYLTQIAYDSAGRALSVTAPKPSAAATFRQQVFVDYQTSGGVTFNETRVRVLGLDNTASSDRLGQARRVRLDCADDTGVSGVERGVDANDDLRVRLGRKHRLGPLVVVQSEQPDHETVVHA